LIQWNLPSFQESVAASDTLLKGTYNQTINSMIHNDIQVFQHHVSKFLTLLPEAVA
jgi:hypothetical protein